MALRTIRELGDPLLRRESKKVTEMTGRLNELIDDMFDTMYDADGVGLAAPQVGIRKQICVIDTGEKPLVLINPEILELEGEQEGREGCLSVPGKYGIVKRAAHVVVRALDRDMNEQIIEADDLEARAIQHEVDHLSGVMYVDKVLDGLHEVGDEEDEEDEETVEEEEEA